MTHDIRRWALISGGLHLAVLLALILVIPQPEPPAPTPPVPTPPLPTPPAEPAPTPPERAEPLPTPPLPVPPPPPAPAPAEEALPPKPAPQKPAPPKKVVQPKLAQQKPAARPAPTRQLASKARPMAASPASSESSEVSDSTSTTRSKTHSNSHSTTSQLNATNNTSPDTTSLLATLEKFRAAQSQSAPPRARANPSRGGLVNGGGQKQGNDTGKLTGAQMAAIGDHVRECWTYDAGAKDVDQMRVNLLVTTDAQGVARVVHVVGNDAARMNSDPYFRAFAERAIRAVLDPHCANLPLPGKMLGQNRNLSFAFKP